MCGFPKLQKNYKLLPFINNLMFFISDIIITKLFKTECVKRIFKELYDIKSK